MSKSISSLSIEKRKRLFEDCEKYLAPIGGITPGWRVLYYVDGRSWSTLRRFVQRVRLQLRVQNWISPWADSTDEFSQWECAEQHRVVGRIIGRRLAKLPKEIREEIARHI